MGSRNRSSKGSRMGSRKWSKRGHPQIPGFMAMAVWGVSRDGPYLAPGMGPEWVPNGVPKGVQKGSKRGPFLCAKVIQRVRSETPFWRGRNGLSVHLAQPQKGGLQKGVQKRVPGPGPWGPLGGSQMGSWRAMFWAKYWMASGMGFPCYGSPEVSIMGSWIWSISGGPKGSDPGSPGGLDLAGSIDRPWIIKP